jgi:pimeloyl-ACP methyl ester carboxylesterase
VAETSYAACGDLSLAYQVFGDGPVELVLVGPFITHVEIFWAMPECKAFFDQLATFCRVLLFDKAGVGLSDPIPKIRLLEERAAEIEAVMDAAGFTKPVLFGMSEGGPQSIVFAAKRPERTRALIIYGSFAFAPGGSWDDLECDPAELRARVLAEVGEEYTASSSQIENFQEFVRAVRSAWGSGASAKWGSQMAPSIRGTRQAEILERMCASPGMIRATLETNFRLDVRLILPTLSVPTLVIHARDDLMPVQCGRYLALAFPARGTSRVTVQGRCVAGIGTLLTRATLSRGGAGYSIGAPGNANSSSSGPTDATAAQRTEPCGVATIAREHRG